MQNFEIKATTVKVHETCMMSNCLLVSANSAVDVLCYPDINVAQVRSENMTPDSHVTVHLLQQCCRLGHDYIRIQNTCIEARNHGNCICTSLIPSSSGRNEFISHPFISCLR